MARLPRKLNWNQAETIWASEIEPIISNPIMQGIALKDISLITGTNVINHKLGRSLLGWFITRIKADSLIHDSQDTNQTPQLTLTLVSSAPTTISLWVY